MMERAVLPVLPKVKLVAALLVLIGFMILLVRSVVLNMGQTVLLVQSQNAHHAPTVQKQCCLLMNRNVRLQIVPH